MTDSLGKDALDSDERSGLSRRTAIKYGGLAAGAFIATPTLLTLGASPASASGSVTDQFANSSSTLTASKTLAFTGLLGRGILVATISVAGSTTLNAPTSGFGSTWTEVSGSGSSGSGLTTKSYWTVLDAEQETTSITVSWTGSLRSVWTGTAFPNAETGVTNVVNKGAPTSGTSITVPAGLAVNANASAVLFIASFLRTAAGTPAYTGPSGFAYSSNELNQNYSTTTSTSGVGNSHWYKYPVAATNDFGSVSASLASDGTFNTASLLAVF